MSSKANWYENDVLLVVENATAELLTKIAFQAEANVKVAAPSVRGQGFDTGFMRNAVYGVGPEGTRRAEAQAAARGAADRPMAETPALAPLEAAVHAAAEYTVYQEMRYGFVYTGVEATAAQVAGIVQEVGRKHFKP